jgi:hypothetical protein
VVTLDGRKAEDRQTAWAGADVFCSLSDNIQETFGIVPIEAMAAGLPVVVSDWDGYKDTVRDGVDGFLVPTAQPADPACALAPSEAYEDGRLTYDRYIGHAHLMVGVNVARCTEALVCLIHAPALRERMGAAGRARAREVYDWTVVMAQYQALWAEQEARRVAAQPSARQQRAPAFTNPLSLFDHYPSQPLTAQSLLWRDPAFDAARMGAVRGLTLWDLAQGRLADAAALQTALTQLPAPGEPGWSVAQWAQAQGWQLPFALRQAVWLHKVGAVLC